MENIHYTKYKYQPMEFIRDYNLNFDEGNIIKYIARAEDKGTRGKDISKAISYIQDLIEHENFTDHDSEIISDKELYDFINQFSPWQTQALLMTCIFIYTESPSYGEVLIDFLRQQL